MLRAIVLLLLLIFPSLPSASAQPRADCSTPRRAARTWLDNLQETSRHPTLAIECFDWEAAGVAESAEQVRLAENLLAVYDQRGWTIDLEGLPDSPEVDAATGADGQLAVDSRLPSVFLEKHAGRWVIAAESIRRIPNLYDDTVQVDVESLVELLPPWMRAQPVPRISIWQLLLLLAGLLVGLLVRFFVAGAVANWVTKLITRQGAIEMNAKLLRKTVKPLGTVAMVGVLWSVVPLLRLGLRFNEISFTLLRVIGATAAVLFVYRLVDLGSDVFARRASRTETKLDDQIVPLIRKTLKVFVVVVGIIFVLQNLQVDVASLLAGVSLGGLAFTLAARDTVANLFGSVSIFADQPFQVGDWVKIDGNEGIVEEVGMRSTRIRTFYDSVISVPNSVVANAAVDNYGLRKYRRCMATLGITYDSSPAQIEAFVEGIRAILQANPHVRQDFFEVHFSSFGSSALEVLIFFFFDVDTWSQELQERQNIYLEIMRLAERLHVSFAFPTQTLHLESAAQPEPRTPRVSPDEEALRAAIVGMGPDGGLSKPATRWRAGGYFAGGDRAGGDADG